MATNYTNTMSSTFFSFVRKHWYASIKAAMVYIILALATYSLVYGTEWFNTVITIISVITAVLFIGFSYVDTWRKALRDYNLVKLGHIQYNKYRGLLSGLVAAAPGLLICILILFASRGGGSTNLDVFKVGYFILYSPFVTLVTAVSPSYFVIYFLPLIITPITGTLGYYAGYRNKTTFVGLMYKQDRSKNKKLR